MKDLESVLAQAAAVKPAVPDDLMARIMADAAAVQPAPAVLRRAQPSRWAMFLDVLGGWPALGGLATAGIVGLWIGAAPPESLENFAADMMGTTQSVDLFGDTLDVTWSAAIDG